MGCRMEIANTGVINRVYMLVCECEVNWLTFKPHTLCKPLSNMCEIRIFVSVLDIGVSFGTGETQLRAFAESKFAHTHIHIHIDMY